MGIYLRSKVEKSMYVIEVARQDGFTGYVYETTSGGEKYLDAPTSLTSAKKWKSFEGASKNKDRFLKDKPDASSLFQAVSVKEVTEQDIKQSAIQIQEKSLQFELESLRRNYSSDSKVEKPMKLKLAELLVSCQPGDVLRYYPDPKNMSKFELAQVEQVVGEVLWVKGQQFRRFDGFLVDKRVTEGRIMPNDDTLSNYLLALRIVKSAAWSDMSVEQVVRVAQLVSQ